MAEKGSTVQVVKLERGDNFAHRSAHARAYLCKLDLLKYITKDMLSTDQEKNEDALCLASIFLLIDGPELHRLVDRLRPPRTPGPN